jgi:hypothetical protein
VQLKKYMERSDGADGGFSDWCATRIAVSRKILRRSGRYISAFTVACAMGGGGARGGVCGSPVRRRVYRGLRSERRVKIPPSAGQRLKDMQYVLLLNPVTGLVENAGAPACIQAVQVQANMCTRVVGYHHIICI